MTLSGKVGGWLCFFKWNSLQGIIEAPPPSSICSRTDVFSMSKPTAQALRPGQLRRGPKAWDCIHLMVPFLPTLPLSLQDSI